MINIRYVIVLLVLFCLAGSGCGIKGDPIAPQQVVPGALRSLQAVVRAEGVHLRWKAPRKNTDGSPLVDLAGFAVLRAESSFDAACLKCPQNFMPVYRLDYSGPRGTVPDRAGQRYVDRQLAPQTVYTYKVYPFALSGLRGEASEPVLVWWDMPPVPPAGVDVQRQDRLVSLTWDVVGQRGAAEAVAGYNVYRSLTPGDRGMQPLNARLIETTRFEDLPEQIDVTYYYTIRSVRKVRETLIESPASAETILDYMDIQPPAVPQALTAVPTRDGMLLKWMPKSEKDFAGFNLYRRTRRTDEYVRLNRTLLAGSSWVDTDVVLKKRYMYVLTSIDRSARRNESTFSEPAEVLYILE
ncbi:MAG: hypothetical protein GY868_08720 [Deltaproteobacteria bacterium]|nr:hypothetical protein [Deltaproteobacteria bacterium]